jgi:hypothetical protein
MKQFLIKSSILTFSIFIIGSVLFGTILQEWYSHSLPAVLLFFYLLTNLMHAYFLRIIKTQLSTFNSLYLAMNFLKMFIYLIVAILVIVLDKEKVKSFLIFYFVLYLSFSILEVTEITKAVRNNK